MSWVRTLLAVWLTLAVPTAGVAAAFPAGDCDEAAATEVDPGPHEHDHHPSRDDHGARDCGCECAPLHCGTALSAAALAPPPVHARPVSRPDRPRTADEIPSPLPDGLYRPPISA